MVANITAAYIVATAVWSAPPSEASPEPLTLATAISRAQEAHPQVQAALERAKAASAQIDRINGSFFPRLELSTRYAVTSLPAATFANLVNQESISGRGFTRFEDFDDLPTTDNLEASGGVSLPLYAGGVRFARRRAAQHGLEALEHRTQAVQAELGLAVARTYFDIRRARARREVALAAVAAFSKNLEVARNRRDAGSMLEQDVLSVEVRLAEAEQAVVVAEHAVELGLRALETLVAADGPVDVVDEQSVLAIPDGEDVSRRPGLLACQSAVASADDMVDVARGEALPRVGAFGRIIFNQGFVEDTGNSVSFLAGVGAEVRLGLDTLGAVRSAQRARAAKVADCTHLEASYLFEARQARIRIKDAVGRIEVARREIDLASKGAVLVRARFEEGLALTTQLNESETDLTSAKVRWVDAEAVRATAIAELRRAMGLPILSEELKRPTDGGDR